MKIAFVYTGVTSYMTDCWRALKTRMDVEFRVWIEDTKTYRFKGNRDETLREIDVRWEYSERISEVWLNDVESEIFSFAPDVVFVCGWSRRLPPFIARSITLKSIPMVLMFDMPWELSLRKIVAKFVLYSRIKRFSAAFVPGKSTSKYARWLGFSRDCIFEGEYSVELSRFSVNDSDGDSRERSGFLYLGRDAREKGLDVLKDGYKLYRRMGGKWQLTIPEYIEPVDVPSVMHKHSCLVLPSRWEPWGVVVLEAMAAGMKTIVSDRVGARLDLPVDEIFKSGDSSALAEAMLRIEKSDEPSDNVDLSKYSTESWARRVVEICKRCRK